MYYCQGTTVLVPAQQQESTDLCIFYKSIYYYLENKYSIPTHFKQLRYFPVCQVGLGIMCGHLGACCFPNFVPLIGLAVEFLSCH